MSRPREHSCVVRRFGDVRIYAKCSCGSQVMARVHPIQADRLSRFTPIGVTCVALELAVRRLKAGSR